MGKSLFLVFGLAGLTHAAYSAAQHRSYLRLTERDFSQLPLDVLAQTVLSLLLCCFGIIGISGKFRPIQITSEWENKRWDNIANRTSFYSFTHRGKYLFSADEQFEEGVEEEEEEESSGEVANKQSDREYRARIEQLRIVKQQQLARELQRDRLAAENNSKESTEESDEDLEKVEGDNSDSESTASSEDLDRRN